MSDYASIKELRKGFEDAEDIDEVESLIRHTLSRLEKTMSELKAQRDRADRLEALVIDMFPLLTTHPRNDDLAVRLSELLTTKATS